MEDTRFTPKTEHYSSESLATLQTLQAILEQSKMRYERNLEWFGIIIDGSSNLLFGYEKQINRMASQNAQYLRGMRDAIANLSHTCGEIAARIAMDERRKARELKGE